MNGLSPGCSWWGPAGVWCECVASEAVDMEMLSKAVGPGKISWLESLGKYWGAWATAENMKKKNGWVYFEDVLNPANKVKTKQKILIYFVKCWMTKARKCRWRGFIWMPTPLDFVLRIKSYNYRIQSWQWLKSSFLLRLLKEFKSKFDHIYFQPQNLCNVLKKGIKPLPCKNNIYYLYVFRGCIKNKLKSYQFSVQR